MTAISGKCGRAPEGAVKIPVGDHVALIDEADADLVAGHRWRPMVSKSGKIYAYTAIGGKTVMMHRLILGTAAGFDTDHRDDEATLDNRRSNLRPATRAQNVANAPKQKRKDGRPFTSAFKGICWDKRTRRWQAAIRINGRLKFLGRFDDETEAARAYDRAAAVVFDGHGQLNFPDEVTAS